MLTAVTRVPLLTSDLVSLATRVTNTTETNIRDTSPSPQPRHTTTVKPHSPNQQPLPEPTPRNMDEDLVAFGIVMLLLSMPFTLLMSIMSCVAYSRTKAWDKARNQSAIALESEHLVENDDSDFVDTDDEEDHRKRQADEEADKSLTFKQKFWKEFKSAWNGKGREEIMKNKEREERRKLAKAVAREMDRRERRRARQAAQAHAEDLPPYKKN